MTTGYTCWLQRMYTGKGKSHKQIRSSQVISPTNAREVQAEIGTEIAQRRGARKRMLPRLYGREEKKDKEAGKQLSPRARKKLQSQAAKTPTPRREASLAPGRRRRERWVTRQEDHQANSKRAGEGLILDTNMS